MKFAALCAYWGALADYSTDFSTIDDQWDLKVGCDECSTKNPDQCTRMINEAVHPGSLSDGKGLTIRTERWTNLTGCSDGKNHPAGQSGHLSFKQPLMFGTIRVKSRYFPGSSSKVKSAKGFIGLQSSGSGAITVTVHGKGAKPSGAPGSADWTKYMQSSCYQHGDDHNKEFDSLSKALGSSNLADDFNWWEITWLPDSVTIKVNDVVVRKVTNSGKIPQKPLYVRIHARSIGYSEMTNGDSFESYVQEFHYTAAKAPTPSPSPVGSCPDVQTNTCLPQLDSYTSPDVSSQSDCCDACQNDSQCVSWTFNSGAGKCYLHDSWGYPVAGSCSSGLSQHSSAATV